MEAGHPLSAGVFVVVVVDVVADVADFLAVVVTEFVAYTLGILP